MPNTTLTRTVPRLLLAGLFILSLGACGGSPPPAGPPATRTIEGRVNLPSGTPLPSGLQVTGPMGSAPVAADGTFSVQVLGDSRTELAVETASGQLLLLGVTDGDTLTFSADSTAEALLYYAVGGMWLPAQHQDKVRDALTGHPAAAELAQEIERMLAAGGNPVHAPDDRLLQAIDDAHAAAFAGVSVAGLGAWTPSAANGGDAPAALGGSAPPALAGSAATGLLQPQEVPATNVLIEPTAIQAGAAVLHNPAGAGVVVQNHYRRPARVLAYEVGWVDADSVEHATDPPEFVMEVDVPSTGQLEVFNALYDVVTGDAPWSPVLSPPLALPNREGASRTRYQLVLLGPGFGDDDAIRSDPRFASAQGAWDDAVFDKNVDLFLGELLLPLVEAYGVGSLARFDAAKLNQARARLRGIYDTHLLELGVYLRQGRIGYANGLKFVLTELAQNRTYRLDMLNMVKEALEESAQNQASVEAIEKRLSSRASASAIAAAVQAVLMGSDVAKIMYDLTGTPDAIAWTVTTAPALFALTPDLAWVTKDDASARFTLMPRGPAAGNYLFRWTTSGAHGDLSDFLNDGLTLVTDSREVEYFHDTPNNITNHDVDTITAEIFEVAAGATSVPPGASPIGRASATVRGLDTDIDSRIELNYGTTSPAAHRDGTVYACAEMYLRFEAVPNAKSYTVTVQGVGGQGHASNSNQDFRYRGQNHTVFIDPAAIIDGRTVQDGYTPDWNGVCTWLVNGNHASQPIYFSAFRDRGEDEYLVHLFTVVQHPHGPNPPTVASRVPLWYEWLQNAVFVVKAQY